MNIRFVSKIVGVALCSVALCMAPSLLISIFSGDTATKAFVGAMAVGLLLGGPLVALPVDAEDRMQLRDGFAAVAGCWVCLSFLCALPYWFSGAIPSFIDALFESASGLTTTGASIVCDIEALPASIKFWRCFTQFLGGMGVLVLMLALLPRLGAGTAYLMRAESPGPIKGKLVPKIGESAKILYIIYIVLLGAETLCLRIAGMSWFDSICHSLATVSTGGFSTKNASVAYFDSLAVDWIIIAFMFLSSVSFTLLFISFVRRKFSALRKDEELRLYVLAVSGAALIILVSLLLQGDQSLSFSLFTDVMFQVVSIVTTTGFGTADFAVWPTIAQCVLLCLMFMGGCAGSTSGGTKSIRLLLLHKLLRRSVHKIIHPRRVHVICLNGKRVDEDTLNTVCVFFFAFCALLAVGTLIISMDNVGISPSLSAALTSLSNVGPGVGVLGPTSNFSILSPLSKITMSVLMVTGRLEILPILVLLTPSVWTQK